MSEAFLSSSWYRVAALKPRLRSHVQIHAHRYLGETWYVLQDSATGRSHRFTPAAYEVIGLMNGQRTVEEIWQLAGDDLGEHAPAQTDVVQLLSQLHGADVLQIDRAPEIAESIERSDKQKRSNLMKNLRSPMSITVPLWDPDAFLGAVLRMFRWLPGGLALFIWFVVVGVGIVLAVMNYRFLGANFTDRVLAPGGLVTIALVYPFVKLLHEFGHGIAAKAYGGVVNTTGVMLLVFYPMPYVDVSSSLAFRSKLQRALVGAAGMMAELFLAALCLMLWLVLEEGLLRALLFDVMLVSSVSTVIVNGNPLLRFDGYYILSDLIEIPNLGTRSTKYWGELAQSLFGVADSTQVPLSRTEKFWFIVYAPLSYVYRMAVMIGIAIFVATHYLFIGILLAAWSLIMGFVLPLGKMLSAVLTGPKFHNKRARALLAMAAVLLFIFAVPIPFHGSVEGVIWLPENALVRSGTDGFVTRLVAAPGTRVSIDDPLLESSQPTLAANIEAQQARIDEIQAQLVAEQFTNQSQAEISRRALALEQAELQRLRTKAKRLKVASLANGLFLVPNAGDLPGRYVKEGQLLGYVLPAGERIVRVVVPQDDVDLVRNRVVGIKALIADRAGETYAAKIVREVPAAAKTIPSKVLTTDGGGRFVIDPRGQDGVTVMERLFQFDLALSPVPDEVRFGARVLVRFNYGWEPVASQAYRRIRQLFLSRFDA